MKAFAIINKELGIYTVIGAENQHHASNKATKLWKNHWDNLEEIMPPQFLYPQFVSLKEFNKRIKEISQTPDKETNSRTPLRK